MSEITLRAPAKVNLYLHITGKREDGYHLVDSLVSFTDFGDQVTVSEADELTLTASGHYADGMPMDDSNLVLRMARSLQEEAGITKGAKIHIDKEIPVSAGVGGGSTDAAAAANALVKLWGVDIPLQRLCEIGFKLGVDMPVCLNRKTVFVDGLGEQMTAAEPIPENGLLLVNPRVTLSTPSVFARRKGGFSPTDDFIGTRAKDAKHLAKLLADRENDLTDPASALVPVVREVIREIGNLDGCLLSRMSGSGATCWGLFETEAAAAAAMEQLKSRQPDWWMRVSHLTSDAEG